MNKGRLVLGIGLIVLAGAIFTISTATNFGINNNEINSITTIDKVPAIHSIKADGIVDVNINVSDTESVRYIFNDNQFKNESTFENGVLSINFPTKSRGFKLFNYSTSGVEVFVSVKSLRHIQMNGVGSIKTEGILSTNEIKVVNEGTGSMNLKIDAQKMSARNSGVGSLNISGTADTATLSNQGVGSIDADKLTVQILNAKNEGVGSMKVYAVQEIKLRNSGVGSLRYSGDARVTSQRSEGVGSISKR